MSNSTKSIDEQSKSKAYALLESGTIERIEVGTGATRKRIGLDE